MAVLIDPPAWPAHGTLFSHLVSDASLEELHAFAAAQGVSPRAFDLDHYDVPAHRHAELVGRGAVAVTGGELVRRLTRSGLRVPARRRPAQLRPVLHRRWRRLFEATEARAEAVDALGTALLERWSEPHRAYHGLEHLLGVLEALDLLEQDGARPAPDPRTLRLAAWFHDAVHAGDPTAPPGRDEEDSAALAEQLLADPALALPAQAREQTARLVRLTADHRPVPGDHAGELLCDADLEVLGRSPEAYARYTAAVRREYAHVPEADWVRGRAAVLESLLAPDVLYRTAPARARWEDQARQNLTAELTALRG
ncbi:DUF4031 domain-containing protein [Micrococcus sp.]|uniref:DUF4031 domain-containing protein n=1 Tax=Micrococcus sp. TaxID=1271 RepID=UPI002A917133|nr:DUF4031 domain-containing protein [Micrococcus sp.]MDY6055765.1 DUF4031 domain-containing protein [Micrococcus sp.]